MVCGGTAGVLLQHDSQTTMQQAAGRQAAPTPLSRQLETAGRQPLRPFTPHLSRRGAGGPGLSRDAQLAGGAAETALDQPGLGALQGRLRVQEGKRSIA